MCSHKTACRQPTDNLIRQSSPCGLHGIGSVPRQNLSGNPVIGGFGILAIASGTGEEVQSLDFESVRLSDATPAGPVAGPR